MSVVTRAAHIPYEGGRRQPDHPASDPASAARRLHELHQALPPTIFFLTGFNFIVLTSNLLVARYLIGLSNFMLAPFVVGKAVLVADKLPLLRRYDRALLIQPILFKTAFYST